jgi:gliding motility-associated-like protein
MLKQRYYILILCFMGLFFTSKASHNRAGEITYKWLYGYTYQIKITTYTNLTVISGLIPPDRCQDTVDFGDGTPRVAVNRSNGTTSIACSPPAKDGVNLVGGTTRMNEYVTTHTYSGPGGYLISMQDPNRNAGVLNMSNSSNQVFYIHSYLLIPTFSGGNNSPILTFPPIDKGCVGKCFLHNPGAYDIDGDSLSYELTDCLGDQGYVCAGYAYPATGGGTYNVNALTGTLTWCTPQMQGEYNLAMIIKEWRKTFDGDWVLVGYVLRDLQVDVGACNNNSPSIQVLTDTCVLAGSLLIKTIKATDPDNDVLTLSANGAPFGVVAPIATFAASPSLSPASGSFHWQTSCAHIRKTPYQVTVKVLDNDPSVPLVDFKTFNITVVAPPPLSLTAVPLGTSVKLNWQKPVCQLTTGNHILYYKVYRKENCVPWIHGYCEVGVPAYTGFTYIGHTIDINDVQFIDNNNGIGLSQGTNYSYIVYALYTDGSESYASNQVCVQLKRDVPILVNVDVKTTNASIGSVYVRWIKPLLGNNALDTIAVPGPYEFRLMHYDGYPNATYTSVYSVTKSYFAALNQLSDTSFTHLNTNTVANAHTYKIEFYANGQFVGNGQRASSIFLSLTPGGNQMGLSWQQQVPWTNYKFRVWRKIPSSSIFVLRDSTTTTNYIDTGLVNGALYCYKIEAIGQYSDPAIIRPLINFSQEVCAKPVDTTPPCAPKLEIISDCLVPTLMLKWNNPNHSCCKDAIKYYLYSAPTENDPLVFLDSIKIITDTILAFDNLTSIAGCYAITAIDSFNNESLQSAKMCVDNCPEYELPNVITTNGDGINDFFKAIKNKFVKDINLKVYNRWGTLVYETTDAGFNWDGKVIQSKLLATEGTYFYVCDVHEIRVAGIVTRGIKGFLQIFYK